MIQIMLGQTVLSYYLKQLKISNINIKYLLFYFPPKRNQFRYHHIWIVANLYKW